MNKPEWHNKWVKTECYYGTLYELKKEKSKERVLDDWIKTQMDSLNERLSQCGKQQIIKEIQLSGTNQN